MPCKVNTQTTDPVLHGNLQPHSGISSKKMVVGPLENAPIYHEMVVTNHARNRAAIDANSDMELSTELHD